MIILLRNIQPRQQSGQPGHKNGQPGHESGPKFKTLKVCI